MPEFDQLLSPISNGMIVPLFGNCAKSAATASLMSRLVLSSRESRLVAEPCQIASLSEKISTISPQETSSIA